MLTALLHSPTLSAKKTRGSCGIDGSNYRSKIAKLFVVTYSQKDFFKPYMQENQFGGIIGFSSGLNSFKNAKLLRRELDSLRKNGVEFLTVDHEGGLVQRLKKYKNVTYMPSARVIGAYLDTLSEANALVQAERIGEIMGWDLAAAGFNWNFGPVFDVDHGLKGNPMTKYHRNFSSDKNRVAKYAAAISKGMRRHVIVTVKHFPGQGMAKLDSHYAGCKKSNSCPDFPAGDLEPFQKAISQGVADSVMVGHVEFANLDNKLATYSKKVIQQILRKRLAYEGLVVSDDFTMGALGHAMGVSSKSFRSGDRVDAIKKAVETALKAGVQLFVFSEYVNGRREAQVVDHICSRISKDSEIRNAVDLAWEKLSAVRQRISKLPAVEFDAKKHKKNQLYIKSILQTVLKTKGRPQVAEWDSKALKNYSL
jgi:beta-N-acetylhexosaminidase